MKQKITILLCLAAGALSLCSCTAPIGADRVTTRQAYAQVEASALGTGKPSAETLSILHRFDLKGLSARQPHEALRQLHQQAVVSGERALLFALAELSYVAAENIRHDVKPWNPHDARDYYLGSAVYAWLFLFGEGKDAPPNGFDRRFREACNFYNYSLGLALLAEKKGTNGVVRLQGSVRQLPVGRIEVQLGSPNVQIRLDEFEEVLLADQLRVRGLSVRNRQPGLGAPLVCVQSLNKEFQLHPCMPATALLRGPHSLSDLSAGNYTCLLELYPAFDRATVDIGNATVPLEVDLTTYRAYTLNQSRVWKFGKLDFLAPERVRNQLILNQPYQPDRIPVVLVHGTFSSPVTWAEMANALTADPVLRQRFQVWSFVYGSGNPLARSIADLRTALEEEVQRRDPEGTNAALRQMVILGHSQGGLLTKCTAVDTGDRLWPLISTNRFEDLKVSEETRAELKRAIFLQPLPFVKRVVFVATPHRGSYLASGFVRQLGRRVVSLPGNLVSQGTDLLRASSGSEFDKFLRGKMPTSLDGMSPKNPALLTLAEIPVAPSVKAHSIIPVSGNGDYREGKDGLVSYQSAHVDYVESEFIVRGKHTCLKHPATIEEVRRILRLHLEEASNPKFP